MKLIYQQPSGWADTHPKLLDRGAWQWLSARCCFSGWLCSLQVVAVFSFLADWLTGWGIWIVWLRRRTFIKPSNCLRQICQVKWISVCRVLPRARIVRVKFKAHTHEIRELDSDSGLGNESAVAACKEQVIIRTLTLILIIWKTLKKQLFLLLFIIDYLV